MVVTQLHAVKPQEELESLRLKKKLEELTRKYKDLEHEFDRLYEENQNIRLIRNKGKIL